MNDQKRFAVHRATGNDIRPKDHDRYEVRHYYGRGYTVLYSGSQRDCYRERGKLLKYNPYNFPNITNLRITPVI